MLSEELREPDCGGAVQFATSYDVSAAFVLARFVTSRAGELGVFLCRLKKPPFFLPADPGRIMMGPVPFVRREPIMSDESLWLPGLCNKKKEKINGYS